MLWTLTLRKPGWCPIPLSHIPWMTVVQVRSALLAGGFSALPIWWKDAWHLVRDIDVVVYLIHARESRYGQDQGTLLQDAVGTGAVPKLHLHASSRSSYSPENECEDLGRGWLEIRSARPGGVQ